MLEQTGWDRDEKQGRTTSFKVLLPTTGPESSYAYILNTYKVPNVRSFPGGTSGKEPACQCRRHKRCKFNPWVGKIPWRRAWQPTPVFLPGKSHGQRSLVGPHRVSKSRTRLKRLSTHTHTFPYYFQYYS